MSFRTILFSIFLPSALFSVSLEQQIGQMILVGFRGMDVSEEIPIIHQISEGRVGGVLIFDYDLPSKTYNRNIRSKDQLQKLCSFLQSHASFPLWIAIDEEGGRTSRLKECYGFPQTYSQGYLGTLQNLSITYQQGLIIAKTLSELGINLNLSPVLDLNINPLNPVIGAKERSFSKNALIVIEHATQIIQAHEKYGILTALKHFPGHGSSLEDSHSGFVDITSTWNTEELIPFQYFITFPPQAKLILIGHVFHREFDPEYPASLSSYFITKLLRKNMGFKGVVITDDLQMKAISQNHSLESTIYHAIHAGADVLLFGNQESYDEAIGTKVYDIILNLVKSGKISRERIRESFERIVKCKGWIRRIDGPLMLSKSSRPSRRSLS